MGAFAPILFDHKNEMLALRTPRGGKLREIIIPLQHMCICAVPRHTRYLLSWTLCSPAC
jgi:hypothetical protein